MTEATYIYALTDPRTEEVRYIGKTVNEPSDRLKGHVKEAQRGVRVYKYDWIRSLLSLGLEPNVSVLEIVFIPNDWQERERWWIAFAREWGFRLTNLTDGGEGTKLLGEKNGNFGRTFTREHRYNLSMAHKGKKPSEETRRKIGEAGKGRIVSLETRCKISKALKGRKHSEEQRRKNSEAHKGYKHSEESKRKISKGHKGIPLSEEHKRNLSKALKGRPPVFLGRKHTKESRLKMSKPYPAFINEDTGEIIPAGFNLSALCRERGLGDMGSVARGKQRSHRGWILLGEKE